MVEVIEKKCPFCNGDGKHYEWEQPNYSFHCIECVCCGARGGKGKTKEEAIKKWDMENESI